MHSKYIAIIVAATIYYFMSDHPKYANGFRHIGETNPNIRLQYAGLLFWQVGMAAIIDVVCCGLESSARPSRTVDGTAHTASFVLLFVAAAAYNVGVSAVIYINSP